MNRNKLFIQIISVTFLAILLKLIIINLDINVLSTGSLLNSMIAGTIFIFGVVLSAVFSEFREVHRLPGELGNHLESIFEDIQNTKDQNLKMQYKQEYLLLMDKLFNSIKNWSAKKNPSKDVFRSINEIARYINKFEEILPANYIVRMRNELFNVRRIFIRIDYARDVNVSEYLETTSIVFATSTIFTMMCTKFDNDLTGLWSVGLLTLFFATIYFVAKALDRPFENDLVDFGSLEKVIKNI